MPIASALPIDNTTPPLIALSILFLIFLLIFAKLAAITIAEMSRHNTALEALAVAMAVTNTQQSETNAHQADANAKLGELCTKIGGMQCVTKDQTFIETVGRRISEQLHQHVRATDVVREGR